MATCNTNSKLLKVFSCIFIDNAAQDSQACAEIISTFDDDTIQMQLIGNILNKDSEFSLDVLANIPQLLVHKYFTNQKKYQEQSTLTQIMDRNIIPPSQWNTGKKVYSKEETIKINRAEDYYAIIEWSLDNSLLQKFESALSKGLVSKQHHSVGVKHLGSLLELKIKGDMRLWTNNIYVNKQGEKLIVFDHCDNHAGIKRQVANNELTHNRCCIIIGCFSSR
ncbi:MAG: hypothetical protein AB8B66_02845 [Rickettsiaceae bacterium]